MYTETIGGLPALDTLAMYLIMDNNFSNIGDWLRYWREQKDLTQVELGRIVGTSKQNISNIERQQQHSESGAHPRPSLELIDKLSRTLGRPASEARNLAGYGLPKLTDQAAEQLTVEEVLSRANFFHAKGLSETDIAVIRPILEALDKQVEQLTESD